MNSKACPRALLTGWSFVFLDALLNEERNACSAIRSLLARDVLRLVRNRKFQAGSPLCPSPVVPPDVRIPEQALQYKVGLTGLMTEVVFVSADSIRALESTAHPGGRAGRAVDGAMTQTLLGGPNLQVKAFVRPADYDLWALGKRLAKSSASAGLIDKVNTY